MIHSTRKFTENINKYFIRNINNEVAVINLFKIIINIFRQIKFSEVNLVKYSC